MKPGCLESVTDKTYETLPTLDAIEAEYERLEREHRREREGILEEVKTQPYTDDLGERIAQLATISDRRDALRFRNAIEKLDAYRKRMFREWCAVAAFRDPSGTPNRALNWVTSYVRVKASYDSDAVTLPSDLAGVRRFGLLSCGAWWREVAIFGGNVREFPCPYGDNRVREPWRETMVGGSDYVRRETSEFEGTTFDYFTYHRIRDGVRQTSQLLAVIEGRPASGVVVRSFVVSGDNLFRPDVSGDKPVDWEILTEGDMLKGGVKVVKSHIA